MRSIEPAVFTPGMDRDRSVGIIVFQDNPRLYLVLTKKNGTDFPKGHPEEGETDEQAALRETKEETGIADIELIAGYNEDIAYMLSKQGKKMLKTVSFFLGRTHIAKVVVSHEHKGFKWLAPQEAMRAVVFNEQRNLIKKAEALLAKQNSR